MFLKETFKAFRRVKLESYTCELRRFVHGKMGTQTMKRCRLKLKEIKETVNMDVRMFIPLFDIYLD